MSNLTQLRIAAREIFAEALRAVDASDAVRHAVHLEGSRLNIRDATLELRDRNIYSIAIGKAAFPMASALNDGLGNQIVDGVIAGDGPRMGTDRGGERLGAAHIGNLRQMIFQGGHPEPNAQSLAAAKACFELLERANQEHAVVIFLISGGGSAMMEWPIDESITLANLRAANKTLVGCGASITEINAVRRGFSAVKGGRLAARAPHCDQITLIVSDVPPGEERNVASGPTLAPSRKAPDARNVIERYNLGSRLPETILRAIEAESRPLTVDPSTLRKDFVLLDNHSALEAAAEAAIRRGFVPEIATDIADQPIEEGCARLLSRLDTLNTRVSTPDTACLISGGEFACPVRGDGIGGRNLETALRLAMSPDLSNSESFVAICAGTDGIDGNSPAAGAIVDNTTIERARTIGMDPEDFLSRSDAYSFFVALGDAIATGPTGTNVRDIRMLLGYRSRYDCCVT
jgi:glycerate 2-kinase